MFRKKRVLNMQQTVNGRGWGRRCFLYSGIEQVPSYSGFLDRMLIIGKFLKNPDVLQLVRVYLRNFKNTHYQGSVCY